MRGIPLGALPAESISIDCTGLLQFFIERGYPCGATRIPVLAWQMGLVHLLVFVDGFGDGVITARPLAKTSGIHITNIDFSLAMHHPLSQIFATPRPLSNAYRSATAQPVVPEPFRRSQHKSAIRCMGDGAIDHPLDTSIGPARDTLCRMLETGFQAFKRGRQQFHVKTPVNTIKSPGLRIGPFIGADQNTLLLLSVVAGCLGIAHHWRLPVQCLNLGQVFGDKVMVLHVHNRQIKTYPLTDLFRKTAGSVNQVLTDDRTFVGRDLPFTVFQKPGSGHPGMPINRCPTLARTRGHGIGGTRWVSMAVIGRIKTHLDVVHHQQGVQFKNLGWTDQMTLTAHGIQYSLDVMEPLHFLICQRESNRTAAVPASRLTGFRF